MLAAMPAERAPDPHTAPSNALRPVLGLVTATAIVVGATIGSGIFLGPREVAARTGGAVGLIAGLAASGVLTWALEWPTAFSPSAVALAFGIAAAVGVFFGFYPAQRAAQLTPIDALRHE